MYVFINLGMLPREEVELIRDGMVLDDDEKILFDMAVRNKTAQEMSFVVHKSPRTIYRMLARMKTKLNNYYCYKDKAVY